MKKRNLLMFLSFLSLPFLVNAEIKDVELVNQLNTEIRMTDGTNLVVAEKDNFYYINGYIDNNSTTYGFLTIDQEGNQLLKYICGTTGCKSDLNYAYSIITSSNQTYIRLIDMTTGEEVKRVATDLALSELFINDEGLVGKVTTYVQGTGYTTSYYLYSEDLSSYTLVDSSYAYDKTFSLDSGVILDETTTKFAETLINEHGYTEDSFNLGYFIKHNNQYYTVVLNEGNIASLAYTDEEVSEIKFLPLENYTYFDYLFATDTGLVAFTNDGTACPTSSITKPSSYGCGSNLIMHIYKDVYNVNIKETTNGKVTITSSEVAIGNEVTYTITPDKGYVLSELIITDEQGNKISTTNQTFSMPSSNVTIEAKFIEEKTSNPETKDYLIMLLALLFLAIEIIIIVLLNKDNSKYEV